MSKKKIDPKFNSLLTKIKNVWNKQNLRFKNRIYPYFLEVFSVLVLGLSVLGGYTLFNSNPNIAKANLVYSCPNGGSLNGSQCVQAATTTCPYGGSVANTSTCIAGATPASCPRGGALQGDQCVATDSTPVDVSYLGQCVYDPNGGGFMRYEDFSNVNPGPYAGGVVSGGTLAGCGYSDNMGVFIPTRYCTVGQLCDTTVTGAPFNTVMKLKYVGYYGNNYGDSPSGSDLFEPGLVYGGTQYTATYGCPNGGTFDGSSTCYLPAAPYCPPGWTFEPSNYICIQAASAADVPTTITAGNIQNSSDCTSAKTIQIPQTYICTFPLSGDGTNNYTLPSGGITAGTSTATGQSQACTILNNNTPSAELHCTQIPTQNGTPGPQNVLVNVDGGQVDKGDVKLTQPSSSTYPITGQNIGNGTCSPASISTTSTTNCTYPLQNIPSGQTPVLPTGGVTAGISTATGTGNCAIQGNNLVCTNVPGTNGTPGAQTATPSLPGSGTAPVTLTQPSGPTVIDLPNIANSSDCTAANKTVPIPNTYNCTFPLQGDPNNNYALPTGGVYAHTAIDGTGTTPLPNSISDACVINNNGTAQASITCNNIKTPVPPQA